MRRTIAAMGVAALLCLTAASAARSADRIYWVDEGDPENPAFSIGHASLAGGGGGQVPTPLGASLFGLGLDTAAGKLYSFGGATAPILSANLDGSGGAPLDTTGAPLEDPDWFAVDPAGGRMYWTNDDTGRLSFASLRSGGGGAFDTTGVRLRTAGPVAVHPAAGKIYWANGETIAFANLSGGGAGTLDIGTRISPFIRGLAIDASAGRIYWFDDIAEEIEFASLNGGGSGVLDTGAARVDPIGLAIDPEADRIYWTNADNGTIGFVSLRGGASGQLDTTGVTPITPISPVLLKSPVAARAPEVKGPQRAGGRLSCESSWAPDLAESFLYRAPQTVAYQWLRNGRPIAGATGQTVTARQAGGYVCQSTAANAAGSTSSTSAPLAVKAALKLGKVRLNRTAGTATLTVAAFGTGRLKLSGAGIKQRAAKARAKARLRIRPSGPAKKRLEATGQARVKVTVSFRPEGGRPLKRSKRIVLKLSRR